MRAPRRTGRRPPARRRGRGRSRCRTPSHRPAASCDTQREAAGYQERHAGKLQEVPNRNRENSQEEGPKHRQRADHAALPDVLESLTTPPAEDDGDEYPADGSPDWIDLAYAFAVPTDLGPLQKAHEEERDRQARTPKADAGAQGTDSDGERVLLGRRSGHMCTTRPRESRAASATASDIVGCAWMASSTSSTVYSFSRATASSWISSEAGLPTMCAPRISPYFLSRMIFTKPSVSPVPRARPFAEKGNRPTTKSSLRSLHWSSVRPMLATSGWQYVTLGTLSYLIGCGLRPAICSATTTPSRNPLCASIGGPATSPIA